MPATTWPRNRARITGSVSEEIRLFSSAATARENPESEAEELLGVVPKRESTDGGRTGKSPGIEEVRPLRKRSRPTNPPRATPQRLKGNRVTPLINKLSTHTPPPPLPVPAVIRLV